MIESFLRTASERADEVFFWAVSQDGSERAYTYGETLAIARELATMIYGPLVVDLPNVASCVFLLLAAALRCETIALLNHRLTDAEKAVRVDELARVGLSCGEIVASDQAAALIERALEQDAVELIESAVEQNAEHSLYSQTDDLDKPAVVLFTTGTTGVPKAVPLTARQLTGAAQAANERLAPSEATLWQATLPLYHVGGLEIVIRSIVSGRPFVLYEHFDATRVLADRARFGITHLSVVDKMLRDLLVADTAGALAAYRCILLGGGPLNPATLKRALSAQAPVWASYGMTETASLIAATPIIDAFDGGLELLDGYEVRIINGDDSGVLAVSGPGVTDGYLGASTPRTDDGLLITGDRARLNDGRLYIEERDDDIFVSGGENVSPAEIVRALLAHPDIADAAVIAVADSTWGARPMAFVESADPIALPDLREHTRERLSRIYEPVHILRAEPLPRRGIGKIDRDGLRALYEQRLEIEAVCLYRLRIPLRAPIVTALETIEARDAIVLEAIDREGRRGLGECDSFATSRYLPETLDADWTVLRDELAPFVLREAFAHPRDLAASLESIPGAHDAPMACAALECALWDLFGQITGAPLWRLVSDEYARLRAIIDPEATPTETTAPTPLALAGATLGIGAIEETLAKARKLTSAGYRRLKVKIAPGAGLDVIRALRQEFPELLLTADANRSFTERDLVELFAYDELDLGWIEEPIAPRAGIDDLARLSALQCRLETPISLDETLTNFDESLAALEYPELRSFTVKYGKLGGIERTLRFVCEAQKQESAVWIGGMFDTGISRRVSAALQTLPAFAAPGDLGAPTGYLAVDVATPTYEVNDGCVRLDERPGLGCTLDKAALQSVVVDQAEIRR